MGVTDQVADGRDAVLAERQLARRRGLQAHLVFQPGDECAVALAGLTGLRIQMELRHQEQAEPLGAGPGALGPREHQMDDVLEEVVGVAVGDEPLDAVDVPGAIGLLHGLGTACADVRTGVGFGEHHGGAPVALDGEGGPVLLLVVADPVQDSREHRAREVHERRRVGAEDELVDRPGDHVRRGHAADLLLETDAEPFAVVPGVHRLLERLGDRHRVGVRVECRWVAVGLGERLGDGALGLLCRLVEHLSHRFGVQIAELAGRQDLFQVEHLEEVELEITHVALVVTHGCAFRDRTAPPA